MVDFLRFPYPKHKAARTGSRGVRSGCGLGFHKGSTRFMAQAVGDTTVVFAFLAGGSSFVAYAGVSALGKGGGLWLSFGVA